MTLTARILTTAFALSLAAPAFAENPMVGGAPMYETKNIIENAVNSKDHTTLVAAVKAAGLVETLEGKGPFTVFAPTNEAFAKLPAGTVDNLLKPENKAALTRILTCHVVAGNITAQQVMDMAKASGKVTIKTVGGCEFTAMAKDGKVMIEDGKGDTAAVTIADVMQSNGVIHVIDTVLLPQM
ncbi:MAG: fasciclin domain-containing protein [Proteobacteria bacterium]|nr:fasciclin domain-containing protein [Pseudomonadota bacterium]MBS0572484.1 fasciclin domain-containing protein [Pseudomonadota bacterium]